MPPPRYPPESPHGELTLVAIPQQTILALESPAIRRALFVALMVAAVVSPNINTVGTFPAVRAEQLLLAAMLPSLGLFHLRHREHLRIGGVDFSFAALAVAMTFSILFAPLLVDSVKFSPRDPFEVARVVEYWIAYRFGRTLLTAPATTGALLVTLGITAIASSLFSILQYWGPGDFNEGVTDYWTIGHNLVGVGREGRVVGFIGNANYYSMFMALPLVVGLSVVLLREQRSRAWLAFTVAVVALSALSMVMAQSRTAAAALLFSMFIGLIIALVARRTVAPFRAIGLFVACVAASIFIVETWPPLVGQFHDRFSPFTIGEDKSAIIRLARIKSFFTGFFEDQPVYCQGQELSSIPPERGHEPADTTGAPAASADVLARDAIRKRDAARLADAVVSYFCEENRWPADIPLAEALVPDHIDAIPTDPSGEPYLTYISSGGIIVGANLENPADPLGPIYSFSTIPNIILNSSFENGLRSWEQQGNVSVTPGEKGIFRQRALGLRIGAVAEADPTKDRGADIKQYVVFEFSREEDYTFSASVRTATGEAQTFRLYLVAQTFSGEYLDPYQYEEFTIPGDGSWVRVALTFRTPKERVTTLQVMLRAARENPTSDVVVDGAALTQGTFAPNYANLVDIDPMRLRPQNLPQFADSPLFGVGPRNDAEAGAFDNEYALFLDRYGVLGTLAYLSNYVAAIVICARAFRRGDGLVRVLGLGMLTFTIGLFVFNVGAGSYYHFALMAIFWLLAGYLSAPSPPELPLPGVPVPNAASRIPLFGKALRPHRSGR